VNSVGTALLYELIVEKSLQIKKIVIASSQAVYGEGKYSCEEHANPTFRRGNLISLIEWFAR
jgi:dTDP-L-rhamnose 4-epimerase